MLALYHNAASTCSQKVRLVLSAKGLEFESRVIDLIGGGQHDPEYVKLNPNHVVPTLTHDDAALIESTLINEYLEDAFPDVALLPADPAARHAARLWVKKIDELHPNAGILTFAIGPRKMILGQPKEQREANIEAIPDPGRRAVRRSVIENGVEAPEFQGALARFVGFLDAMQSTLPPGGWLSGDSFGLADAAALPYVLRVDHLAMTPIIEARPTVADWYDRVRTIPSYDAAVTDWLPAPIIQLFHANGAEVWPQVEKLLP